VAGMTMAQFYAARLDELAARTWAIHDVDRCDALLYEDDLPGAALATAPECDCGYPAQILREVEAGRKLLAEYTAVLKLVKLTGGDKDVLRYREFVLQHRAAVHNGHPDYNPDWAPA
jgi:hypothetical protein